MYVKFFDGGYLPITDEKAGKLTKLLEGGTEFINLAGNIIRCSQIVGIYTEDTFIETQIRAKGLWKCTFGHWHTKNQSCSDTWESAINGHSFDELMPLPKNPVDKPALDSPSNNLLKN